MPAITPSSSVHPAPAPSVATEASSSRRDAQPGPNAVVESSGLSALRRRHGAELSVEAPPEQAARPLRQALPTLRQTAEAAAAAGASAVASAGAAVASAGASAGAAVLAAGGTLVRTGAAAAETLHAASLLRPIATGTMAIGSQMSVAGILQRDSSLLWRGLALGSVGGALIVAAGAMQARPPANMQTLIEAVGMLTGTDPTDRDLTTLTRRNNQNVVDHLQDLATRPASELHPSVRQAAERAGTNAEQLITELLALTTTTSPVLSRRPTSSPQPPELPPAGPASDPANAPGPTSEASHAA